MRSATPVGPVERACYAVGATLIASGPFQLGVLDWLLIIGQGHLDRILRVYVEHYNQHRPHRALWLEPPDPARPRIIADDHPAQVHRRDLLGGLLHEYRRAA